MSTLKQQLIRLGYQDPSLRDHLRPILDVLTKKEAYKDGDYGDQSRNRAFYPEDNVPEAEKQARREVQALSLSETLANIKRALGLNSRSELGEYGEPADVANTLKRQWGPRAAIGKIQDALSKALGMGQEIPDVKFLQSVAQYL